MKNDIIELKALAQHFLFDYNNFANFALSKPELYQVDESGKKFMLPKTNMDKLIRDYSGIKR